MPINFQKEKSILWQNKLNIYPITSFPFYSEEILPEKLGKQKCQRQHMTDTILYNFNLER